MESHGAPGTITITDETKRALSGEYFFEANGVREIKGKGPMQTWSVKPIEAAGRPMDVSGIQP